MRAALVNTIGKNSSVGGREDNSLFTVKRHGIPVGCLTFPQVRSREGALGRDPYQVFYYIYRGIYLDKQIRLASRRDGSY